MKKTILQKNRSVPQKKRVATSWRSPGYKKIYPVDLFVCFRRDNDLEDKIHNLLTKKYHAKRGNSGTWVGTMNRSMNRDVTYGMTSIDRAQEAGDELLTTFGEHGFKVDLFENQSGARIVNWRSDWKEQKKKALLANPVTSLLTPDVGAGLPLGSLASGSALVGDILHHWHRVNAYNFVLSRTLSESLADLVIHEGIGAVDAALARVKAYLENYGSAL
jgi:hypothetical protein